MDKKEFLNKVLFLARHSLEPEPLKGIIPCDRFTADDFYSYIGGSMPSSNLPIFENHCLACLFCAARLSQAGAPFIQEQEKEENELLLEKTMALLDRLEHQEKEDVAANTMHIVIEAVKNALHIIRTSGEILKPGFAMAVRGEQDESDQESAIQILQEFTQPDLSIQATIIGEEPERATLQVSLFDRAADAFMPDVEMHLIADSRVLQKEVSDEKGEAKFLIQIPGEYQINLLSGGRPLAWINVGIKIPATGHS